MVYRYKSIHLIFGKNIFFQKFQNFMVEECNPHDYSSSDQEAHTALLLNTIFNFKPIGKYDGDLVKIYRRPKRATQLIRLMFLHYAQMIITRSCPYSYRFSSLTQSTEPAQNEALLQRTTEQICSNVYIHSDFSIDIDLVQNREAVEKKCISSGYRKIASVNHVDVFVGPTRECEAWQKIIRRL
ncbi:hypothetical protein T02_15916, partial [Trichinella nativa]